ncbi:MAG: hypothetical protein ISR69_06625 [Gammaproteobacteria bacterium]|nr:hypothetical protein [Gammaproteobacteria bacterium]
MKVIILMLTLLFVQMPALAIDKTTYDDMISVFLKAVEGDSSAQKKSYRMLSQLNQQYPEDALVKVYLGSILAIKGRDAWMPWNKLNYTEKGMDLMDDALNMLDEEDTVYVDHLSRSVAEEVKTTAAATFTQVPKMFGRFEQGLEILTDMSEQPEYTHLKDLQRGVFEYYLADALQLDGQKEAAEKWFSLALKSGLDKTKTQHANEFLAGIKH